MEEWVNPYAEVDKAVRMRLTDLEVNGPKMQVWRLGMTGKSFFKQMTSGDSDMILMTP